MIREASIKSLSVEKSEIRNGINALGGSFTSNLDIRVNGDCFVNGSVNALKGHFMEAWRQHNDSNIISKESVNSKGVCAKVHWPIELKYSSRIW